MAGYSMIRKSGHRFSEQIMLNQEELDHDSPDHDLVSDSTRQCGVPDIFFCSDDELAGGQAS
jgi:hypothetical protein